MTMHIDHHAHPDFIFDVDLDGRYGLKGFPTVLLFIDGEIRARFSGARAEHWVKDFLAEHGA